MKKNQITPAAGVTDETLKLAPSRLLKFLQGVTDPAIVTAFDALKWSDERLEQAWSLLSELQAASTIPSPPVPDRAASAIASCESWQATGLVRARAMLQLAMPEHALFMFHDFIEGTGTAATLNVATFLERRQALEDGPDRKATRKADHEALAILDAHVTKETRKQLQEFVDIIQTVVPARPQQVAEVNARRTEVLRKIYAWITAWSEMARTVITRRDQLIKLGIAKRRPKKAKSPVVTPAAPPVVVTPAAPPVVANPPAPSPVATPPVAPPAIPEVAPSGVATVTSLDDERGPDSRAA